MKQYFIIFHNTFKIKVLNSIFDDHPSTIWWITKNTDLSLITVDFKIYIGKNCLNRQFDLNSINQNNKLVIMPIIPV